MYSGISEPLTVCFSHLVGLSWKLRSHGPPEIFIAPHPTFNLERMLGVPDGFAIEVADLRKILKR